MQAAPAPSKGALKCPPRQGHSANPADRDLEFSGQGLQVVSRSERYLPATQAALVKNKKKSYAYRKQTRERKKCSPWHADTDKLVSETSTCSSM